MSIKRGTRHSFWRFGPALTAEENRELARRYRDGDPAERAEAREAIIRGNQGMVISVAERFDRYNLDMEDRIQEGNVGLLRAIDLYDPERSETFSTYAEYHIRAAIGRANLNTANTIRIPVWVQNTKRRDKQEFIEAAKRARASASLNRLLAWGDLRGVFCAAPKEDEVEANERTELVAKAISRLPKRYQTAIRLRHGFHCEPQPLAAIGRELGGVTVERARQICAEAERRLRGRPELLEVAC